MTQCAWCGNDATTTTEVEPQQVVLAPNVSGRKVRKIKGARLVPCCDECNKRLNAPAPNVQAIRKTKAQGWDQMDVYDVLKEMQGE